MSLRHQWNRADFMFLTVVAILAAVMLVFRHARPAEPAVTAKAGKHKKHKGPEAPAYARDWSRFPAVAVRSTSEEVVALGDVHGGYDRLVALLAQGGLLRAQAGGPDKQTWSGGRRLLVCTGDLINKGDKSIEALELMMSLQKQAAAAGGEVIVTFGNHEAEFLANPNKKKQTEFRDELQGRGIDASEVIEGEDGYGEWMLNLPIAAKVNQWFFAHAGNTGGASLDDLGRRFREVVDRGDWRSPFLIGDDSILESQKWWQEGPAVDRDLQAVNASHIVFGHDPGAAREKGTIEARAHGRVFVIDVGMSPAIDYSKGALLLIDRKGGEEVATSLDASGERKELWRGPAMGRQPPAG
ncbi:MAG TPA: metallophosphoesterase [Vicinamibacteria bacterium]|jgi:hypothetical protein